MSRFPDGKVNPEDEGATCLAMAVDPANGIIVIRFPKPMNWLGLPLKEAKILRDGLDKRIKELESHKN